MPRLGGGASKADAAAFDDPAFRYVLRQLIRSMAGDASVLEAEDGAEGLRLAHADPAPELILLDPHMPDVDSFKVLRALQDESPTGGAPVIVVTSAPLTPELRARLAPARAVLARATLTREVVGALLAEVSGETAGAPPRLGAAG